MRHHGPEVAIGLIGSIGAFGFPEQQAVPDPRTADRLVVLFGPGEGLG